MITLEKLMDTCARFRREFPEPEFREVLITSRAQRGKPFIESKTEDHPARLCICYLDWADLRCMKLGEQYLFLPGIQRGFDTLLGMPIRYDEERPRSRPLFGPEDAEEQNREDLARLATLIPASVPALQPKKRPPRWFRRRRQSDVEAVDP